MAGKSTEPDSGSNIEPNNIDDKSNEPSGDNGNVIDPASIQYGDEYERDGDGNLVYGASGKPKRKRGRKSGGGTGTGNSGSAGNTKQKRSGNNQNLNDGIDTLSKTLMIFHMGIASLTDFKGFELEKTESDALAYSVANVMEQFDMTPDPRFTAIAGLVTTAATIYGPRIYLYREDAKEKRMKKAKVVTPVNQTQGNNSQTPGNVDMQFFGDLGGGGGPWKNN